MIRLFVGISLPIEVKEALNKLYFKSDCIKWVAPENLLLTLYYIGEVQEEKGIRIHQLLQELEHDPFAMVFRGVGCFSQKGVVRSVYANIEASKELLALQEKIVKKFKPEKTQEKRLNFRPHVTLGRADKCQLSSIENFLHVHRNFLLSPFNVNNFTLFSVQKAEGGVQYQTEAYYTLKKKSLLNRLL